MLDYRIVISHSHSAVVSSHFSRSSPIQDHNQLCHRGPHSVLKWGSALRGNTLAAQQDTGGAFRNAHPSRVASYLWEPDHRSFFHRVMIVCIVLRGLHNSTYRENGLISWRFNFAICAPRRVGIFGLWDLPSALVFYDSQGLAIARIRRVGLFSQTPILTTQTKCYSCSLRKRNWFILHSLFSNICFSARHLQVLINKNKVFKTAKYVIQRELEGKIWK